MRAADVAWTVGETVPSGWTLESLKCTSPTSGRQVLIDGSTFVANLAEGDRIICTYTNELGPPPTHDHHRAHHDHRVDHHDGVDDDHHRTDHHDGVDDHHHRTHHDHRPSRRPRRRR